MKNRFSTLVEPLHEDQHISSTAADKALKQYNNLISNQDFLSEAKKFDINNDRVDDFYSHILHSPTFVDLGVIARLVMILSHGNAQVESGFSINGDILQENMLESTIVAQRLVYEGIRAEGGTTKVPITQEMEKMVSNAHRTFKAAREAAAKDSTEAQKRRIQKRKATTNLNSAIANKKAAVDEMKKKIDGFDAEIYALYEQLRK